YQTEVGKTYLRGYQFTDFNGEAEFVTIFPGWYNGRICHIHFQVFVSSVYAAISQLSFPIAEKNAIYAAYPDLYTKGADGTTSFNSDNIFSDGYALQLATLTPNATTGGYDSYLEVAIAGSGVTALRELEPETGGQFKLRTNHPNPFSDTTTIPFSLTNAAQVKLELFDLNGKQILELANEKMSAGEHEVTVHRNMKGVELTPGGYVYRLAVENSNGRYSQSKLLTVN
ncbi:MAG: T9SS type A sorting domain-containing protein, partial [Bacteroidota bacterium]